jgi:hypothetical protein
MGREVREGRGYSLLYPLLPLFASHCHVSFSSHLVSLCVVKLLFDPGSAWGVQVKCLISLFSTMGIPREEASESFVSRGMVSNM